jgi:hypothetical protein
MRQDQFERLQALSEKLIDIALAEADPDNWPGSGWKPNELTKEQRGDRYWCKKNAVATLALEDRVNRRIDTARQASSGGGADAGAVNDDEAELDAEIAAAEKEASRLLDDVQRKSRKEAFDKHVHGK